MLLLLLLMVAGACHEIAGSNGTELGERFPIKYGQQILIKDENLVVRLDSVAEDSRCPEGMMCVWAGNARVVLTVIHALDHTAISLNTTLKPKEVTWLHYNFKLLSLSPYPKTAGNIKPEDYVAELIITKE